MHMIYVFFFLRDFILQKIKTLKTSKLKTGKIKSLMEEEKSESVYNLCI